MKARPTRAGPGRGALQWPSRLFSGRSNSAGTGFADKLLKKGSSHERGV